MYLLYLKERRIKLSFKDMFMSMDKANRTYVTGALDLYLTKQANKPNDRAINVNAPSQAGKCQRANFYMRTQVENDGSVDPRTQRIFDNGTYTHERLQSYMLDMGLLICDEVPLINEQYNIQGHTDGILDIGNGEIAVLEIKSINDRGFTALKDAKEEHKKQGLIYLYCLEERRKYLHEKYKTREDFFSATSKVERSKYFESKYQHMKDGSHYTRKEKIENEVKLNMIADDILYDTNKPITKVVFLYENKNNQELKEYVVERNVTTESILTDLLEKYEYLNKCIEEGTLPEREGTSKSCNTCRWCSYQNECWVV